MIGDGDVGLIFESGAFNEAAVFTITPANPPTDAVTLTVQGWFTDSTEQTNVLTGEVEAALPMFDCETAALETEGFVVRKGMSVTIDGTAYRVERLQKLGTGVTTVHLKT